MCASGRQSSTGWSDEVQPDPTLDHLYVPGGGLGVDRTDTSGSFTADELQQMILEERPSKIRRPSSEESEPPTGGMWVPGRPACPMYAP